MVIRQCQKHELEILIAIARSTDYFRCDEIALNLMRENLAEFLEKNDEEAAVLVYEENKEIIGFISYIKIKSNIGAYWLSWLAIRKDKQGKGIGTALLKELEKILRGYGARILLVDTSGDETWEPGIRARNFYLKNGFKEAGRIPTYYWDDDDAIIYYKIL